MLLIFLAQKSNTLFSSISFGFFWNSKWWYLSFDSIFINRTKTIAVDWLAYPHYEYGNMAWTQTFKLAHNLYYTSAVEGIGSAMEMSALAAKNVANYAFNDWFEVKLRNKTSTKYEL